MINNRVKLLASRCLLRYTTAVSTRNFDFCALSTQYSPTACSRTAPRPRSPPSTGTRIWHWVSRVIHTDKRAGLAADMFANETIISLGKSKSCKKSKIRDKSEPKCQVKKQHIGPGVRLWLYPVERRKKSSVHLDHRVHEAYFAHKRLRVKRRSRTGQMLPLKGTQMF